MLCTSLRMMNELHRATAPHLAAPALLQGMAPKGELLETFKARGDAMKDAEWQAYLAKGPPLLAEMHSTLLMPTNYSPLK